MRIMAIDYGDQRIGLAVSDLLNCMTGEAWTMQEWNMERASLRIAEEAKKREVGTLVLGLKRAGHSRPCSSGTAACPSSSGTNGAAASRRTPFSTPPEKKSAFTAARWTPSLPA